MKKINKYIVIIIVLFLTSCGISGLGIEKRAFIVDKDDVVDFGENKCKFESLFFSCETTNNIKNISIQKDNYNVSLGIYGSFKFKSLSFGFLPIIPPPPIIPVFFFPAQGHKDFCGGKNLKIILTFFSDESVINENNISIDLDSIYLFKDNKKIYANNYYLNNNYLDDDYYSKTFNYKKSKRHEIVYIVDFPISCKKSNNSLLFIKNLKKNNENINLPIGKIIYTSDWNFGIGYMTNN